jgi:hypothetical protein
MARPEKFDADFFPHGKDFRDKLKVKALRRKFGLEGYAVLLMILEVLASARCIQIELDDFYYELLSGDFLIDVADLKPIIKYLLKIELLLIEDGYLRCCSLDESLIPLFERRTTNLNELRRREAPKGSVKELPEQKLSGNPHSIEENSIEENSRDEESREKLEKERRVSERESEREGLRDKKKPGFTQLLNTFNSLEDRKSACTIHEEGDLDRLFNEHGYTVLDTAFNEMKAQHVYTISSLEDILVSTN